MKTLRLPVLALAVWAVGVCVLRMGATSPGANGGESLGLPKWFGQVRVSRLTYRPYGAYWADESTLLPEKVLRARAAKALRRLNDARPQERLRAVWDLRPLVGVISFPEGLAAMERVWRTDPHLESVKRIRGGKLGPLLPTTVYTVREVAGPVVSLLKDRLVWEKWLANQPRNRRAENAVKLLLGRGYPSRGLLEDEGVIVVWLVRHPAESLPVLTKIESGRPSLGSNGVIPTVETPNWIARMAAASVIGANKARKHAPYLSSLLDDPTCHVQTWACQLLPTVGGKIEPRNLVKSYPVRDAAAGALQALAYKVTFDGRRYHAKPPATIKRP